MKVASFLSVESQRERGFSLILSKVRNFFKETLKKDLIWPVHEIFGLSLMILSVPIDDA